jgi:methanogenic corrinoid protein MtbC1
MPAQAEFVSPKQAARAIGVSESSLKRWSDQGLIPTVRTAGGHRKLAIAEVVRFFREHNRRLQSPEILGLPPASDRAAVGLKRGKHSLVEALLGGDELAARQIILELYLARHSLAMIFDVVVAAAFHEIGDLWACRSADVFQERRGVKMTLRIFDELRRLLPDPSGERLAIGGTLEGDWYSLPAAMAGLVLREAGFRAELLGTSIPALSLVRAVELLRPQVFWVAVSHVRQNSDFVAEFAALSNACQQHGAALVVGGRALTPELRQQMSYSAFCDNLQHLEGFARALRRPASRVRQKTATPRSETARSKRDSKTIPATQSRA